MALLALVALASFAACAGRPKYVPLPPISRPATISPGDSFDLEIVGEEKLPKSYTVAPNGTVEIPYINAIKVTGLQQHEIAALIKKRLIEMEVRTDDPTVVVSNCNFKSKRVEVTGEVAKSGSLELSSEMTLTRAITEAGGFTGIANRDSIIVLRRVSDTKVVKATISWYDVVELKVPNPLLQGGDQVIVKARNF